MTLHFALLICAAQIGREDSAEKLDRGARFKAAHFASPTRFIPACNPLFFDRNEFNTADNCRESISRWERVSSSTHLIIAPTTSLYPRLREYRGVRKIREIKVSDSSNGFINGSQSQSPVKMYDFKYKNVRLNIYFYK